MSDDRFRALVRDALALHLSQCERTHESVRRIEPAVLLLSATVATMERSIDSIRSAREHHTPPTGLIR